MSDIGESPLSASFDDCLHEIMQSPPTGASISSSSSSITRIRLAFNYTPSLANHLAWRRRCKESYQENNKKKRIKDLDVLSLTNGKHGYSAGCYAGCYAVIDDGVCPEPFIATRAANSLRFTRQMLEAYLKFLETDDNIRTFLLHDYCYRCSDHYSLAAVFIYFCRAGLKTFTRSRFFVFLYMIGDFEDEDEESRIQILPYLYGEDWRDCIRSFSNMINTLIKAVKYRLIVSDETVKTVMSVVPSKMWQRFRMSNHGNVIRPMRNEFSPYEDLVATPPYCHHCAPKRRRSQLPTTVSEALLKTRDVPSPNHAT